MAKPLREEGKRLEAALLISAKTCEKMNPAQFVQVGEIGVGILSPSCGRESNSRCSSPLTFIRLSIRAALKMDKISNNSNHPITQPYYPFV